MTIYRTVVPAILLCIAFLGSAVDCLAQTKAAASKLSTEDEKSALDFAQQHHPELAELIERLQEGNRAEYRKALVQLHETKTRLERFRERSPDRFVLLLAQWKLDSRLRLLVAQMEMSDDPQLSSQIDKLLAEKVRNREQIMELDRNRARERLNRILEQITELKVDEEAAKQKELNAIRRSLGLPMDSKAKKPTPKRIQVKTKNSAVQ